MKNKTAILIIVLVLILGAIIFLENQKVIRTVGGNVAENNNGKYNKAPDFVGINSWINSQPIKIDDLKGKVVLVDFWTYSCINCLRTLPYLNAWNDKYSDQGLVIVSIHTPEFEFEKKYDNVAMAAQKYGIKYAIALDNNYATWNAYQNNYWPRKYLIDKDGYIRFDHIGEGGYGETEMQIQELLAETGNIMSVGLVNVQDETPTTRNTQELYAGYRFALERGQNAGNDGGLKPDVDFNYVMQKDNSGNLKILNDIFYLEGLWSSMPDAMKKYGFGDSSIYLKFTAKNANIVADSTDKQGTLEVFIDGNYISKDYAGKDVQFDGDRAYIKIDEPRLYEIYNGPYGTYTLKLTTSNAGFSFNAFTFG